MGTKIEYVDSNHLHATNYIRNSKAIAVLWVIFSVCYSIISTVAFFTPGNFYHLASIYSNGLRLKYVLIAINMYHFPFSLFLVYYQFSLKNSVVLVALRDKIKFFTKS